MRTAEEMVAYTLEIDPVLLPFLPELLQDFEKLGSNPGLIVQTIADLDLADESRILDLGCGKGAVAIAIASRLGLPVLGIDLFEPFIRHCERMATEAGVAELCTFRQGDILTVAERFPSEIPGDIAVFGALGDVLGPLDETVGIIRDLVNPGGLLVISDDYVKDGGSADFPGFQNYASREETVRRLESHADVLIEIVEESNKGISEAYAAENALIWHRAERLIERHPELRQGILNFVQDQKNETDFLEKNMVPAIWVLRIADH